MNIAKDITNNKYGKLTAICFDHTERLKCGHISHFWKFKCDCGNIVVKCKNAVLKGNTTSCGCYRKERSLEINRSLFGTHLMTHSRLYRIWRTMKGRCYCKKKNCYNNYGGRGISVCDLWKNNFIEFYNWAKSSGYEDNLTIDRIDVNGNYEPSNCRWITKKEQERNKRCSINIEYNGETKNLATWAEELNVPHSTMYYYLKRHNGQETISHYMKG